MKKLSKEEMKKLIGGQENSNCPPDTYACLCTDGSGHYGDPIDATGQNILEAFNSASETCETMGWYGATCSENWNC